ncbi:hypothetical protein HDU93_009679 [Gonapodya sp. JEL0774]|nr:hypothetical protein HDU93_009679 [Gonapodya sp. JEL0774]
MDIEMTEAAPSGSDSMPAETYDTQEPAPENDVSGDVSRDGSDDEAEEDSNLARHGNGIGTENGQNGAQEYGIPQPSITNGYGAPSAPVPTGNGLTKPQQKYLQSVVKNLKGLKDAYAFLAPVDTVRLNIPDYHTFVKKPMDLGTVSSKLERHEYKSVEEFKAEIDLVWRNCYLYNGRQSPVSLSAANLEAKFESLMKNCPKEGEELPPKPRRYSSETRGLAPVSLQPLPSRKATTKHLNTVDLGPARETYLELIKPKHQQDAVWFSLPVDPQSLGIPHYFDIIKHPMDLSTIRRKLDHQEYDSLDAFAADCRLMFNNCFTFNPPDTAVYISGKRLEKAFEDKWREVNRAAYGLPKKSMTKKADRRPEPEEFSSDDSDSDSDSSDSNTDSDTDSNGKKVKQLEEKVQSIFKQIEALKAKGEKKRKRKEKKEKRRDKKKRREERRATGGGYYEKSKHKLEKRPKPLPMTAPLPLPAPPMPYVAPTPRPAPPPAVPKPAAPPVPKKPKKAAGDGPPKKKAKKVERVDDTGPFIIEMKHKQYLTDQINSMSETNQEHLGRVFQIIQENVPNLAGADQGEVELDIDALDQKTLWALYDFVRKLPGHAPAPGMGTIERSNVTESKPSPTKAADAKTADTKVPDSKTRGNLPPPKTSIPKRPAAPGGFDLNKLLEDTAEDKKLKELAEQKRKMEEETEKRRAKERAEAGDRDLDQSGAPIEWDRPNDAVLKTMDPRDAREARIEYERALREADAHAGEMDINRQNCLMNAFEKSINGHLSDGHHYPPRDGIENALKKARETIVEYVPTF